MRDHHETCNIIFHGDISASHKDTREKNENSRKENMKISPCTNEGGQSEK